MSEMDGTSKCEDCGEKFNRFSGYDFAGDFAPNSEGFDFAGDFGATDTQTDENTEVSVNIDTDASSDS